MVCDHSHPPTAAVVDHESGHRIRWWIVMHRGSRSQPGHRFDILPLSEPYITRHCCMQQFGVVVYGLEEVPATDTIPSPTCGFTLITMFRSSRGDWPTDWLTDWLCVHGTSCRIDRTWSTKLAASWFDSVSVVVEVCQLAPKVVVANLFADHFSSCR